MLSYILAICSSPSQVIFVVSPLPILVQGVVNCKYAFVSMVLLVLLCFGSWCVSGGVGLLVSVCWVSRVVYLVVAGL